MAPFPYTISYWNVRGLRSRMVEVEIMSKFVDICGLGETRLHTDTPFELPGFNVFRNNGGCGVLLGVRQSVPHRPVQLADCPGGIAVAAQVWSCGGWVLVVAVYGSGALNGRDWEDWLSSLPRPMILCGDLNAHHILWGSQRQNGRGVTIATSLGSQDLVALNDGTSTFVRWYGGRLQESVLDLVLCSSILASQLRVAVSDDLRGSDHLPILVGASLQSPLAGISGSVSQQSAAAALPPRVVTGSYGQFLHRWGLGGGRKRVRRDCMRQRSDPLWWTDECRRAVRDRRRAYRQFRRWAVPARWEAYQVLVRFARGVIRGAKRSYGARLCTVVDYL